MSIEPGERRRRRALERAREADAAGAAAASVTDAEHDDGTHDGPATRTVLDPPGVPQQASPAASPAPDAVRGVPRQASPLTDSDDRPLSRRALRERERHHAAEGGRDTPGTSDEAPSSPVPPPVTVPVAPEHDEHDEEPPQRWTWGHVLTLVAVVLVLGLLVWSHHTTAPGGTGALGPGSTPTPSPSAPPAAPEGVL